MKVTDTKFTNFLNTLHPSLQDTIESTIDFSTPEKLDDDFLQLIKGLDTSLAEMMKSGATLSTNDEPEEEIKVLFCNTQNTDFDFTTAIEEQVIVWDGDYVTENDLVIADRNIVIINGQVICKNITVNEAHLFVNGKVICNVLFGASCNDMMTHIIHGIKAKSIVENGHYTLVEDSIYAENIVMIHNEITSNNETIATNIYKGNGKDNKKLSPSITNNEGYFDEEKFLHEIQSTNYKLFN